MSVRFQTCFSHPSVTVACLQDEDILQPPQDFPWRVLPTVDMLLGEDIRQPPQECPLPEPQELDEIGRLELEFAEVICGLQSAR